MACLNLPGLLNATAKWLVIEGPPLLRLVLLLPSAWAIGRFQEWLSSEAPGLMGHVRSKCPSIRGRNPGAEIVRFALWLVVNLLQLVSALFAILAFAAGLQLFLEHAMPPLLQIAATYHSKMLDFVMILVTVSSILLIYVSTTEEHARLDKETKYSSIRQAKRFGLLCVILSVSAPFVDPFLPSWVDYMLGLGVLALILQVFFALDLGI